MQADLFGAPRRRSTPRYYQEDAIAACVAALQSQRSTLAVLATGLGKTTLFSEMPSHFDGRVLVLAHRDELITQAAARLQNQTGEPVGIEKAENFAFGERVVVASVQSLKAKRLERMALYATPDLIVIDEAHRSMAPSYRDIFDYFSSSKLLGVTATPYRADKSGLGNVFEGIAYQMGFADGVRQGWLCRPDVHQVLVEDMDLSRIGTTAGDLNLKALNEEMLKHVEGIVKETLRLHGERCGPVFFPGKVAANLAAERFNALKPGCAAVITDDTSPEDRSDTIARCHAGDLQYLCNVNVATEGFDWPGADIVVLGRPTKSKGLYAQMIGRGSRTEPGVPDRTPGRDEADTRIAAIAASGKPGFIILDFVGNCGKHQIANTVDLFAEDKSEAVKKRAKQLLDDEKLTDPLEAIAAAEEDLAALARSIQSKVKATVQRFDFFRDVMGDTGGKVTNAKMSPPATPAQIATLEKSGVPIPDGLTKAGATAAIAKVIKRRQKNLATPRQLATLAKYGWEKPNIYFKTASQLIDFVAGRGWRATKDELEGFARSLQ